HFARGARRAVRGRRDQGRIRIGIGKLEEKRMKIDKSVSAVVTGGASGLGKASAQALAAAGAKVAIFDVNVAGGEAVAKEIGGVFCKVDITSEESAVAGFEKARASQGQERVLVHCAMTSKRGKTL